MADTYDLHFVWPHTEPRDVVVTGTFDNWSSSVHLNRTATGFEGTVKVPWGAKVVYKFRLDGDWIVLEDQPTEIDPIGNVNNMTYAPEKPVTAQAIKASLSGSVIVVDKEKAVPAYTVPTPASIAASLSQGEDAQGNVAAEPEPMSLDPVAEEKDEPATTAPDVPLIIQPVLDQSADTTNTASPGAGNKPSENGISTHTPAPEGTATLPSEPEPKSDEVKAEAGLTTPLPEPKQLATNPAAAANVPLPPMPAAASSEAPESTSELKAEATTASPEPKQLASNTAAAANVPLPPTPAAIPPETPSKAPPVPDGKPSDSVPPTPTKTNGTSTPVGSAPTTPKKTPFPSESGDETGSSPSSVRSRLGSVRKKRLSIIDKIKSVFHHDHHEHNDNGNAEEHKEGEKEKEVTKKDNKGTHRRTSLFKSHSAFSHDNEAK